MNTLAADPIHNRAPVQHDEGALRSSAQTLGRPDAGFGPATLMGVLYDPQVRVEGVISALESDSLLTARVIAAANAPCYQVTGQVGSLQRAVQMLGLPTIRGVAAAAALDRLLPASPNAAFDAERFRRHSLATACAAQMLSNAGGCGVDSEAFIAGLLHEVGWLLLAHHDPEAVARYEPPKRADAASQRAAERAHFGLTLRECGVWLAEAWQLPVWLRDAIGQPGPTRPAPVPFGRTTLPALVALAHSVVEHAGLGLRAQAATPWNTELAASLRLESQALHSVAAALRGAMAKVRPG
jgi:HD-like signal output (HDOD) protein